MKIKQFIKGLGIVILAVLIITTISLELIIEKPVQGIESKVHGPSSAATTTSRNNVLRESGSIQCGDHNYIFVQEYFIFPYNITAQEIQSNNYEEGTFNIIYKDERVTQNIVFKEISSFPKDRLDAYVPVSAPKDNCDRIFLTRSRGYQFAGLYEFELAEGEMHKLVERENFNHSILPVTGAMFYPYLDSPNGEKILAVSTKMSPEFECDLREIVVYDLLNRTEIKAFELPAGMNLSDNKKKKGIYTVCTGINIGWLSNNKIFYDFHLTSDDSNLLSYGGQRVRFVTDKWYFSITNILLDRYFILRENIIDIFSRYNPIQKDQDEDFDLGPESKLSPKQQQIWKKRKNFIEIENVSYTPSGPSGGGSKNLIFDIKNNKGFGYIDLLILDEEGEILYGKNLRSPFPSADTFAIETRGYIYNPEDGTHYLQATILFTDGEDLIITGDPTMPQWDDELNIPVYFLPNLKISASDIVPGILEDIQREIAEKQKRFTLSVRFIPKSESEIYIIEYTWDKSVPSSYLIHAIRGSECKSAGAMSVGDKTLGMSSGGSIKLRMPDHGFFTGEKVCAQIWEDWYNGIPASEPLIITIP